MIFWVKTIRAGLGVLGSRFWVFSEEACNFRFAPVLKGVGNSELDVV